MKNDINVIDNTPEEILFAVNEMLKYLSNKKVYFQNINNQQQEFWKIYYENLIKFNLNYLHCSLESKTSFISAKFLFENPYLLK